MMIIENATNLGEIESKEAKEFMVFLNGTLKRLTLCDIFTKYGNFPFKLISSVIYISIISLD